jgi:hypothetical protein
MASKRPPKNPPPIPAEATEEGLRRVSLLTQIQNDQTKRSASGPFAGKGTADDTRRHSGAHLG